jgi:hypothetical protein
VDVEWLALLIFVRIVLLIILITERGGRVVSTPALCSGCNIDHLNH